MECVSTGHLADAQERFEGMRDDPDGVPPFHYGSHYSSAGAWHWQPCTEPGSICD